MTMKPAVRDNSYYLKRLERDHPIIYSEHLAGKFRSVRDALVAAGLKSRRTRLQELKNAFSNASPAEQAEFRRFVGCAPPLGSPSESVPSISSVGDATHLSPQMILDVKKIITDRNMKVGELMLELGLSPLDPSLGMALNRGTQVKPALKLALEVWIAKWMP